jgi:hypothetical protein
VTPDQIQLLDFIRSEIELRGTAPSYTRLADVFGCRGRGGMHDRVSRLVEAGQLVRERGRIRLPGVPNLAAVPIGALRAEIARRERAGG